MKLKGVWLGLRCVIVTLYVSLYPITRQTFNYATLASLDEEQQNVVVVVVDPDKDDQYRRTPKPLYAIRSELV